MIVRLVALVLLSLSSVAALGQQQPPDAGTIFQTTREPFRLPPPSPNLAPKPPEPKPALGAQPKLANVYLQSHQVQQQDPQHPVRFVLGSDWVSGQ